MRPISEARTLIKVALPVQVRHKRRLDGLDAERQLASMPPVSAGGTSTEVKGRVVGADTFTVTESEIGVGRNQPDHHILALVAVDDGAKPQVRYLRRAFDDVGDLPFDSIGVNCKRKPYFERAQVPA